MPPRVTSRSFGSFFAEAAFGDAEGAGSRSPTRTEVRSPTSTSTEVRSPTNTSTSTEVRSPTSTSTSTDAYTSGNVTVTGGAGSGHTTVHIHTRPYQTEPRADREAHLVRSRGVVEANSRGRIADLMRATSAPRAVVPQSMPAIMRETNAGERRRSPAFGTLASERQIGVRRPTLAEGAPVGNAIGTIAGLASRYGPGIAQAFSSKAAASPPLQDAYAAQDQAAAAAVNDPRYANYATGVAATVQAAESALLGGILSGNSDADVPLAVGSRDVAGSGGYTYRQFSDGAILIVDGPCSMNSGGSGGSGRSDSAAAPPPVESGSWYDSLPSMPSVFGDTGASCPTNPSIGKRLTAGAAWQAITNEIGAFPVANLQPLPVPVEQLANFTASAASKSAFVRNAVGVGTTAANAAKMAPAVVGLLSAAGVSAASTPVAGWIVGAGLAIAAGTVAIAKAAQRSHREAVATAKQIGTKEAMDLPGLAQKAWKASPEKLQKLMAKYAKIAQKHPKRAERRQIAARLSLLTAVDLLKRTGSVPVEGAALANAMAGVRGYL